MLKSNSPNLNAVDNTKLHITTTANEDVVVLAFNGDLSVINIQAATEEVNRIIANHKYNMIFNFKNLSYVDSFGIGFIISTYKDIIRCGGDLKLVCLSPFVDRVLRGVLKLDFFLNIYDTQEDALLEFKSNAACAVYRWQTILEKQPNYPDAHLNLALIFWRNGLLNDALNELDSALEINPNYIDALNARGQILLKTGKIEEAINCFKRVIENKPDNLEAMTWLALCYADSNMLDEAIIRYNNIIEIYPKYPDLYYKIGMAYLKKDELELAVNSIKKAIEINPCYLDAHRGLAIAYLKNREKNMAVNHLQSICNISMDPGEIAQIRELILKISRGEEVLPALLNFIA